MMKQVMKVSLVFITIALSLTLLVTTSFAEVRIFPPDSAPYGRTYSEWMAAWQQWVTSIPATSHPLFDTGPADTGQSGPVFFLGGKFCAFNATDCGTNNVVRNITVPAGKAFFFPIVDAEVSTVETGGGDPNGANAIKDINALRQLAAQYTDGYTNLALEVDGHAVQDIQSFRVQSTAFEYYLPANDIFTAIGEGTFTPGNYFPGVDDGYYVMLKPLAPGKHTIHFHAYAALWTWTLDVTYNVTIQ